MFELYHGDAFDYLRQMDPHPCIFADPPDNLGLEYNGYVDKNPNYFDWMDLLLRLAIPKADVFWLSFYHKHLVEVSYMLRCLMKQHPRRIRQYIWRFNFGQYGEKDHPNGYRPIFRISKITWKPKMDERVESEREKLGDKRASGTGRVPDDVWEYGRIQGNNSERREWHPTQHPEDIYRRIMRMSGRRFLDLFAGTGTCFRAGWDGIDVTGVEQSLYYCRLISEEHNLEIKKCP